MCNKKCLLNTFLVMTGLSLLVLILFLYFGDDCMRNCCIFKLFIIGSFILCILLVLGILFCADDNKYKDSDEFLICSEYLLIHKGKNKIVYTRYKNINDLLQDAADGDKLIIYSDDFRITPEILHQKDKNNKEKEITLINDKPGCNKFIISIN